MNHSIKTTQKTVILTLLLAFAFGPMIHAQFTEGEYYTIVSALDNNLVLDVEHASDRAGANLIVGEDTGNDNQLFQFQYAGGGYFYIMSKLKNNYVIDVNGGEKTAGTNVQMWDLNETAAQKFKLVDAGDGYYYIQSALQPDYVIDISNGHKTPGTNLWMYTLNRSPAQKFKLKEDANGAVTATFNDAIVERPREPIELYLKNQGDFIADFTIEYQTPGYLPSVESFSGKRYNWSESLTLPLDANNIVVSVSIYTDFAWDKKKIIINKERLYLKAGERGVVSVSGNYNSPKAD